MLIQFSAENFRSIKATATLSMEPTAGKELPQNLGVVPLIRKTDKEYRLSKVACLYGANASGKSNIIKALSVSRQFIIDSFSKFDDDSALPFTPFLLDDSTADKPSVFEYVFVVDSVKYRYGFKANKDRVVSEWLFHSPNAIQSLIFARERQEAEFGKGYSGWHNMLATTRENCLLLTVGAALNNETCKLILKHFKSYFFLWGSDSSMVSVMQSEMFNADCLRVASDMLQFADTSIVSVDRDQVTLGSIFSEIEASANKRIGVKNISDEGKSDNAPMEQLFERLVGTLKLSNQAIYRFRFKHSKRCESSLSSVHETFSEEDESSGTIRYLALLAQMLHVIFHGGILIADELDTSLHNTLSCGIVRFFARASQGKSQLIFTTHNTEILTANILRRDQVWITQKSCTGDTELSCLSDFDTRFEPAIGKRYLQGRFGGVPSLHEGYFVSALNKVQSISESLSNHSAPEVHSGHEE